MKIAFLGNMNNWSYAVSKRMVSRGYDVTLFVDAPPDYLLDRPEAADTDLKHGYPPWIVELKGARSSTSIPYLYIRLAFRSLIQRLEAFDVVFLNGMFISLAPYVRAQVIVVAMFSGFDLDLCAPRFVSEFAHARFHKYKGRVPVSLLKAYYSRVWRNQALGIRRADIVDYFAPGMNPESDEVLATIKRGQSYRRTPMRRALACDEWAYRPPNLDRDTFHVLSAMRFDFLTVGRNDNKRNDLMLEGIGLFVCDNAIEQGLVIDFFEKGQDVDAAKAICRELRIERFVRG